MDINATCADNSTMDNSIIDIDQLRLINVLLISDDVNFFKPLNDYFKSVGNNHVSVAINRENAMLLYCSAREYDFVILNVASSDDILHSAVSFKQLQKIFCKDVPVIGLNLLNEAREKVNLNNLKEIEQYLDDQFVTCIGKNFNGSYEIMTAKIIEWVNKI